jgi:hypothetical protein
MNPILLDFEKLLATIKNRKNNIIHYQKIFKMIILFENKHKQGYDIQIRLLVTYLHNLLREQIKIYNCEA